MADETHLVQRPLTTDDLVRRLTSKDTRDEEKTALHDLAECMIYVFNTDPKLLYVPESAALAPVLGRTELAGDLVSALGNFIIDGTADGNILNVDILRSFAFVLWHTENLSSSESTLGSVLRSLLVRLQNAKEAAELRTQYLTICSISTILDSMVDIKLAGLGREGLHQPLLKELKDLRDHIDLRLALAAAYAYQALLGVKDDESPYKAFWRYTTTGIKVATSVATAATVNPMAIIPAASSIIEMLQGLIEAGKAIAELMSSLCEFKEWTDGLSKLSRQKNWYRALRYTDLLMRANAWSTLKRFTEIVPCRNDEQFRCGLLAQVEVLWKAASERGQSHIQQQAKLLYEQQRALPTASAAEIHWFKIVDQTITLARPSLLPMKKGSSIVPTHLQPFILGRPSNKNGGSNAAFLLGKGWESSISARIFYADEALKAYYTMGNRLHVERVSGVTLPLDKCYINLMIMKKDISKADSDNSWRYTYQDRLETSKRDNQGEAIALEALFGDEDETRNTKPIPKRIFIEGRAGIGKTTLCKKIVHEFLCNRLGRGLFDRILWLPLRKLARRSDSIDWYDLFLDECLYETLSQHREALAKALSTGFEQTAFRERSLILLDGLDEVAQSISLNHPMYRFLMKLLSMPNVIITSRPQGRAFDIGNFDLQLETIGFNTTQVEAYLHHCIADETIEQQIQSYLKDRPIIHELLRVPIQLDAFCYAWTSKNSASRDLSTMTLLFRSMFIELCRKDVLRLEKEEQALYLEDFEIETLMNPELEFLQEFAFQGLINSVVEFSSQHQRQLASHMSIQAQRLRAPYKQSLEKLSFLRTSGADKGIRNRSLHFLHLTTQEFLAARHFVEHWIETKVLECLDLNTTSDTRTVLPEAFIMEEKYNPRYNIFWRFVTGLVQLSTKSNTHKGLPELFESFAALPRDLLGFSHHRLLMYTLNEVAISSKTPVCNLRATSELDLVDWAIFEHENDSPAWHVFATAHTLFNPYWQLAYQAEYPEAALQAILPWSASLFFDVCGERTHISSSTLNLITGLLNHPSESIFRQALRLLERRQDLKLRAIEDIIAHLEQTGSATESRRCKTAEMLRDIPNTLPAQALTSLLRLLKDDKINFYILDFLGYQPNLPQEAILRILRLVEDHDIMMSSKAASIFCGLYEQMPHSVDIVLFAKNLDTKPLIRKLLALEAPTERLLPACIQFADDEDLNIRSNVAWLLCSHKGPLPNIEAVTAQDMLIHDKDPTVRASAARALASSVFSRQSSQKHLADLLKDPDVEVRAAAVGSLTRSSFSDEDLMLDTRTFQALLQTMLDGSDVSKAAATAIGSYLTLPVEILNQIQRCLLDKKRETRQLAIKSLEQHKIIPLTIIHTLVAALSDPETCSTVANLLEFRHLSPDITTTISKQFTSGSSIVRASAARALRCSKPISDNILNSLVTLLADDDDVVSSSACRTLECSTELPETTCKSLMEYAVDEGCSAYTVANRVLKYQKCLPLVLTSKQREEPVMALISRLSKRNVDTEYSIDAGQEQRVLLLPQKTLDEFQTIWLKEVEKQRGINGSGRHGKRQYSGLIPDIATILGTQSSLPDHLIESIIPSTLEDFWAMYAASRSIAKHIQLPPRAMDKLMNLLRLYCTDRPHGSGHDDDHTIWSCIELFVRHAKRGWISIVLVADLLNSLSCSATRERLVNKLGEAGLVFNLLPLLHEELWVVICEWWTRYAFGNDTSCYTHQGKLHFRLDAEKVIWDADRSVQERFIEVLRQAMNQRKQKSEADLVSNDVEWQEYQMKRDSQGLLYPGGINRSGE